MEFQGKGKKQYNEVFWKDNREGQEGEGEGKGEGEGTEHVASSLG